MNTVDVLSKSQTGTKIPYFDLILPNIVDAESDVAIAYGEHVHWGYWEKRAVQSPVSAQEYLEAATRLTKLMLRVAGIQDGMSVLDIGSGLGGTVRTINSLHTGMVLKGINIDEPQVERARTITVPREGNQIEFCLGDAHTLPFEDQIMDVVLAVECIFHFDRKKLFREVNRVLKKDGVFVISDFVPKRLAYPVLKLLFLMGKKDSDRAFGEIDLSCTIAQYENISAETSFSLAEDINITKNTLPTYPFLTGLIENSESIASHPVTKPFLKSVKNLEALSKPGLLDYKILKFVKC